MKKLFLVGILILLGACSTGSALKVSDVWARPGKIGGNSAAYFTVVNSTNQEDRLLMAESGIAEKCEIHMTKIDMDNKMMMMPQDFIVIPAGGKVDFAPGGLHVMILNLKKDLLPGDNLKLTLQFEKAGKIELDIPVKE